MRAFQAVLVGGAVAGVLDLLGALAIYRPAPAAAILRSIARGVLGPAAARGGVPASLLGLVLHFTIAMGAASVFVFATRRWPDLARRWWLTGPVYGMAVFLVMNYVVVPLSAIGTFPGPWTATTWQVVAVHVVGVGPPIALAARYYAGATTAAAPVTSPRAPR